MEGYQALADECALKRRRLWLIFRPGNVTSTEMEQLAARSNGWLRIRVERARRTEDDYDSDDEDDVIDPVTL
jgi:hypothetical protein